MIVVDRSAIEDNVAFRSAKEASMRGAKGDNLSDEKPLWEIALAVNGDAEESDLALLPRAKFEELAADSPLHWVGPQESISLAGESFYGQSTWWWLALVVLLMLLLEMSILAWPQISETPLAPVA